MADSIPAFTNPNSRRGNSQRQRNMMNTSQNVLGGSTAQSSLRTTGQGFMNQNSNEFGGTNSFNQPPKARYSTDMNGTFNGSKGFQSYNNTTSFTPTTFENLNTSGQNFNPNTTFQSSTPKLNTNILDRRISQQESEIRQIDEKLKQSSGNGDGFKGTGTEFYNPSTRVRRRDTSLKRGESSNFNNTNNSSMNATFGVEKQPLEKTLDVFEQKELELKKQLQLYEKEQKEKEKIQQVQENLRRQQSDKHQPSSNTFNNTNKFESRENSDQKKNNLQIRLSSPTFTKKKPAAGSAKKDTLNKEDLADFGDYVPGQVTRKPKNSKPVVPEVINNDEEIAVATGLQDMPMEDSQIMEQEQLTCPEGCGRQFNAQALQKHIPICKKVFQKKENPAPKKASQPKSLPPMKKVPQKLAGNLAEIKKKMKQQTEKQGGQKDELLTVGLPSQK